MKAVKKSHVIPSQCAHWRGNLSEKVKKYVSAFLCLILLGSLLTGCHGSKEAKVFEIPESFDTSRNYEISFWAKNDTNPQSRLFPGGGYPLCLAGLSYGTGLG